MQAEGRKGNSTFSEQERKHAHLAQTGPPCSPAKSEDILKVKGTLENTPRLQVERDLEEDTRRSGFTLVDYWRIMQGDKSGPNYAWSV